MVITRTLLVRDSVGDEEFCRANAAHKEANKAKHNGPRQQAWADADGCGALSELRDPVFENDPWASAVAERHPLLADPPLPSSGGGTQPLVPQPLRDYISALEAQTAFTSVAHGDGLFRELASSLDDLVAQQNATIALLVSRLERVDLLQTGPLVGDALGVDSAPVRCGSPDCGISAKTLDSKMSDLRSSLHQAFNAKYEVINEAFNQKLLASIQKSTEHMSDMVKSLSTSLAEFVAMLQKYDAILKPKFDEIGVRTTALSSSRARPLLPRLALTERMGCYANLSPHCLV